MAAEEFLHSRIKNHISLDNAKGISIRDLTLPKENIIKLAKEINISIIEIILKNYWYIYDGEYYYLKKVYSAMRLVNELLGEYLSKYMGVPTIEYSLVLDLDKIVGLLSKNFREKGKKYVLANELPLKKLSIFKNTLEQKKIDDLRMLLDKILIKDFYSCLTDRNRNTLCLVPRLGSVSLAPSFDYEYSFINERDALNQMPNQEAKNEFDIYYSPIFVEKSDIFCSSRDFYPITYDTIKGMMEYDEYLVSQFEKIMEFDILKALNEIQDTHGIKINQNLVDYYCNFDKTRKDQLENKIRKIS